MMNELESDIQHSGGLFTRERHGTRLRKLEYILRNFSPAERLLLYVLTALLSVSTLALLANVNTIASSEVPARGGSLLEGGVGTPRFINPVLATSQADQDLTALIYSGLVRADAGVNGYIPDLADRFEISDDGTMYTFHLREGLTFHNGEPLAAADIAFTIGRIQHPDVKSPRRADWEGVHVETPDERTVVFTLPAPYAPFLENASVGILPKALWENVPPDEFAFSPLNTNPVGSGPYRIDDVALDTTGTPQAFSLAPFSDFSLGTPHVSHIVYRSYATESALQTAFEEGEIDSYLANSPKNIPRAVYERARTLRAPQSRVFGIFFNQNHASILADASVRKALGIALDKQKIVDDVLGGYGTPLEFPVPPGLIEASSTVKTFPDAETRVAAARDALSAGGWSFDEASGAWLKNKAPLSVTLATADTEELVATAEIVVSAWKAVGVQAEVQVFPLTEFNQNVLRPRNYDAVLFGEVVSRSLDLFAFWHSSQRNDPGLNLALYTNTHADRILTESRAATTRDEQRALLGEFLGLVEKDAPAVFLYSPDLVYLVPQEISGITLETLTTPADRFTHVYKWYRDTERVWNIFN